MTDIAPEIIAAFEHASGRLVGRDSLAGIVAALAVARRDYLAVLADLADPDPCWFDHHGGCQAHGYLSLDPGEKCPQAVAKEMLEADAGAGS